MKFQRYPDQRPTYQPSFETTKYQQLRQEQSSEEEEIVAKLFIQIKEHLALAYESESAATHHPILSRKNFTVVTGVTITKILTEIVAESPAVRTTGVSGFRQDGNAVTFKCNREVILCCGAVQTPILLKLSGIGPREELESHGIPVVKELQGVGENLQDHLIVPFVVRDLKSSSYGLSPSFQNLFGLFQYQFPQRQGPLSTCGVEAMGFFSTDSNLARSDARPSKKVGVPKPPNMQFHLLAGNIPGVAIQKLMVHSAVLKPLSTDTKGIDPKKQLELSYFAQYGPPFSIVNILVTLLHPKSKGFIKLGKNKDDMSNIFIDPKYLSEEQDLEELANGFEIARKLHAKMKQLEPKAVGDEVPDEGVIQEVMRVLNCSKEKALQSRLYSLEYVRRMALTLYHPIGTAKMGPKSDPMTVVDHETLKVHGILNLRVRNARELL